jgi:predicted AlkP superfamily pyrophosphatase or phosphodiesterase
MAAQGYTRNRLVVVSMDGLSETETGDLRRFPHFSSLLDRGAVLGTAAGVYPSLTYVVHATMVSGRYPDCHGIDHNHPLQPGVPQGLQRWYWYAHELTGPTLFDAAHAAGLKCAAVLWPLTARGCPTWNFPEIVALPGENQILKVLRSGSPGYLLELQLRFGRYRKGGGQPHLDDFVSRCASFTLEKKRPDLLMTHLIGLDDAKHKSGTRSPETDQALRGLDDNLGRILQGIDRAGGMETTNLVLIGDHGHIDIQRRVRLNRLLIKAGLAPEQSRETRSPPQGFPPGCRAWFRCSGGSAFLHIKPGDSQAANQAADLLAEAAAEPSLGIGAIHRGKALRTLRCGRNSLGLSCAVDALPGTQFVEDPWGEFFERSPAPGAFGADHGYPPGMPDYRGIFLALGPSVRPSADTFAFNMVDVAPTLAKMMDIELDNKDGCMEGRVVPGLLAQD